MSSSSNYCSMPRCSCKISSTQNNSHGVHAVGGLDGHSAHRSPTIAWAHGSSTEHFAPSSDTKSCRLAVCLAWIRAWRIFSHTGVVPAEPQKKIAMCLGIKCGAISMFNIQLTSLQRLIPRWCFADSQPKMKAHLNQSFGFQMVWWIVSVATCPAEHQIERHSRMPGHTQNSTSSGQLHPSEISERFL